jgi:hypothetical protein
MPRLATLTTPRPVLPPPRRRDQIPRQLAYAVAEITRMPREDAASTDAAWTVEIAWNAVLAGDIDDLHQHLQHERAARDS